jgi:hypothetical protein
MRYFLILITCTCFAFDLIADESCNQTNDTFSDIIKVAGKKCLTPNIGKDDLVNEPADSKPRWKNFCDACKAESIVDSISHSGGKEEVESLYGKAVLNEFQKELTFITIDLMKMRSSFPLDFNPKQAIGSCKFNKTNLKKPACLSKNQSDEFDQQVQAIKNALASELSSLISGRTDLDTGLLSRELKNLGQCEKEISDKEIQYAQARYYETTITPKFIADLKEVVENQKDAINFLHTDEGWYNKIKYLKDHPIFKFLLNDSRKLKGFLSEIKASDNNEKIIENLYSKKHAGEFGDFISDRCNKAFEKASTSLETTFCKESPSYIADNLTSMELVIGEKFSELSDEAAEEKLQILCADLNTTKKQPVSFLKANENKTDLNNNSYVALPLSTFKRGTHDRYFSRDKRVLCETKNNIPGCTVDSKDQNCMMLNFISLSKNSKDFMNLANGSNENINLVLRSLIDNGLPQKDGKADQQAVVILKTEGILSGSDLTPRPPQQDAASFHRAVANSNNNSIKPSTSQAAKAPTPTTPAQPAPTSQTTTRLGDESQYDSQSDSQFEAVKNKTDSAKTKNSFSSLSDQEQMNLLNRMKPKSNSKKSARTAKSESTPDSDDSYSTAGQSFNSGSFATDQAAAVADNTAVDKPTIPQSEGHSGSRAKLDPKKIDKDASFNEAKIQASQNRAPASDITKDTVISLSKTDGGLNKIEIKVPDESVLGKKTPELESKIQDYLDKSGQSLQGAKKGEAFIVKLGKYDIKVSINDYGVYVATCKDKSIHPDYLAFLSRYFTGIKERVSSSDAMKKVLIESTSSK